LVISVDDYLISFLAFVLVILYDLECKYNALEFSYIYCRSDTFPYICLSYMAYYPRDCCCSDMTADAATIGGIRFGVASGVTSLFEEGVGRLDLSI